MRVAWRHGCAAAAGVSGTAAQNVSGQRGLLDTSMCAAREGAPHQQGSEQAGHQQPQPAVASAVLFLFSDSEPESMVTAWLRCCDRYRGHGIKS